MRANLNALEELLNWITNQLENHKDEARFVPELLEELHSKRASVYYVNNDEEIGTPSKRRKNREIVQESTATPMVMEEEPESPFSQIPFEILLYLVELPILHQDLTNLSLVNKNWHKAVLHVRKSQPTVTLSCDAHLFKGSLSNYLQFFSTPSTLVLKTTPTAPTCQNNPLSSLSQLSSITSIKVQGQHSDTFASYFLQEVLPSLTNLRSFSYIPRDLAENVFKQLSLLPNLETLHYSIPKKNWNRCLATTCQQLKFLHIEDLFPRDVEMIRDMVHSTALATLGRSLTNLRSLILDSILEGCQHIIAYLCSPNLERVAINQVLRNLGYSELSKPLLVNFFARHRQIKSIVISGEWYGYNSTVEELEPLYQQMAQAEFLELDFSVNYLTSHCKRIMFYCKNLRVLKIQNSMSSGLPLSFGTEAMTILDGFHRQCPHLERIVLDYILESGPRLTEYKRTAYGFERIDRPSVLTSLIEEVLLLEYGNSMYNPFY